MQINAIATPLHKRYQMSSMSNDDIDDNSCKAETEKGHYIKPWLVSVIKLRSHAQ